MSPAAPGRRAPTAKAARRARYKRARRLRYRIRRWRSRHRTCDWTRPGC
ncbi:hypothetical protein CLV63_119128 [Murinocardiopsis flavida]|uniref:Uncharacterized protein n=1 Tax=Murinocardiopsis flavida TaxID=645275 RepID=A0A2P8D3Q7_9ACTN|nr:hypothetical protein CLV63_119128 [Murinocardiopsis flavida]